jgi:hypothetical protein
MWCERVCFWWTPLMAPLSQRCTARPSAGPGPATGFIVVKGFLDPRWLVEIEADAVVDR